MDLFNADGLSGEDLAEVDFLVAQTNAATTSDDDRFVVERIVEVGQSGIRARGRLIELKGAFHVERFVRALAIKDFQEPIEAGLLLQEIGGSRLGGFFLQGEMHTLVAAILLRMARLDAFNADAQPKPPDGEFC